MVEVLIAIGLLGIAAVAMAQLHANMIKSQNFLSDKFEYLSQLDELERMLSDNAICQEALAGNRVLTSGPHLAANPEQSVRQALAVATLDGIPLADYRPSDSIRLSGMEIQVMSVYPAPNVNLFRTRLLALPAKRGGGVSGLRPRPIPMDVQLDGPNGLIVSCSTDSLAVSGSTGPGPSTPIPPPSGPVPLCSATTTATVCRSPDAKRFDCPAGYVISGYDCTGDCGTKRMYVKCTKLP